MQGSINKQLQGFNTSTEILGTVVKQERPLKDGLERILDIVCRHIGTHVIFGTLIFTESTGQTIALSWSPPVGTQEEVHIEDMKRGLIRRVMRTSRPQIVQNVRKSTPTGYVSYPKAIGSELAVPLLLNKEVVGAIDIASSRAGAFGERDKLWLQQVATLLQLIEVSQPSPPIVDKSVSEENIDLVLDDILKTALSIINRHPAHASILIVDDDRVVPKRRMLKTETGKFDLKEITDAQGWSQLRGVTGRAVRGRKAVIVPDIGRDKDYFDYDDRGEKLKLMAEVAIPVMRGTRIVGILDTQAQDISIFTAEVIEALKSFAKQIDLACYIAQLSERLRREQGIINRLTKVAPSVVKSLEPRFIYKHILEATLSLLPTASASQILTVALDDQTKEQWLTMEDARARKPKDGSEGTAQYRKYQRYPLSKGGVAAKAVQTGEIKYEKDVRELTSDAYIKFLKDTISELAIPLVLGSTVLGVLNIEGKVRDAFSKRDQDIAELLAAEAGFAISSAQDYTRTIDLLKTGIDAMCEIIDTMQDIEGLIDSILDGAMRVAKAQGGYCGLLLVDEGSKKLKIRCEKGSNLREGRSTEWPLDQGLIGRAMQGKRPVNQAYPSKKRDYNPMTSKTRSILLVQLLNRDNEALGLLSLESPVPKVFNEHAIRALQQLAPLVVAAFEKSEQVHSLQQRLRETVACIKQVPHLLKMPVRTLRDVEAVREATAFFDLMLDSLDAKAEFLGQTIETYQPERVDVRELVNTTVKAYQFYATSKPVKLVYHPEEPPVSANVNRHEVLFALAEILNNAVIYNPQESQIDIYVDKILGDVEISVEDRGEGVPATERERIFQRDVRGSNAKASEGTGLGLHFVREAMYRQGGDAYVRSRLPSRGSRFVLRFPASQDGEQRRHPIKTD